MDIAFELSRLAGEKTCLVGMGNTLRGDDGVGVYVTDAVKNEINEGAVSVIIVEDVLENYVFDIARRDEKNVILVDGVRSGAEAGTLYFGKLNELGELINDYSTHRLSVMMSGKVFEEHGKETYLLGIEVNDTDLGSTFTEEVKKSADAIRDLLVHYINCTQKEHVYES